MDLGTEFGKKLSLKHIPTPKQPRVAQLPGQGLQLTDIVRISRGQNGIVVNLSRDKAVVGRIFIGAECAVDEQPLDPRVPHASWIAGQIHPSRNIPNATQTGLKD